MPMAAESLNNIEILSGGGAFEVKHLLLFLENMKLDLKKEYCKL